MAIVNKSINDIVIDWLNENDYISFTYHGISATPALPKESCNIIKKILKGIYVDKLNISVFDFIKINTYEERADLRGINVSLQESEFLKYQILDRLKNTENFEKIISDKNIRKRKPLEKKKIIAPKQFIMNHLIMKLKPGISEDYVHIRTGKGPCFANNASMRAINESVEKMLKGEDYATFKNIKDTSTEYTEDDVFYIINKILTSPKINLLEDAFDKLKEKIDKRIKDKTEKRCKFKKRLYNFKLIFDKNEIKNTEINKEETKTKTNTNQVMLPCNIPEIKPAVQPVIQERPYLFMNNTEHAFKEGFNFIISNKMNINEEKRYIMFKSKTKPLYIYVTGIYFNTLDKNNEEPLVEFSKRSQLLFKKMFNEIINTSEKQIINKTKDIEEEGISFDDIKEEDFVGYEEYHKNTKENEQGTEILNQLSPIEKKSLLKKVMEGKDIEEELADIVLRKILTKMV